MGTEKLPTGVEIRRERVRIWFRWQGERFYETIGDTSPTVIKRAAKLRTKVVGLIKANILDEEMYVQLFPNTNRISSEPKIYRFFDVCQKWLNSLEVATNTRNDYKKSLNRCWIPYFADHDIRKIKISDIRTAIVANNYQTNRTRNNTLVPLRGVFKMALEDKLVESNIMESIEHKRDKVSAPDPLELQEANTILNWIKANKHPIFYHYFVIAIHSGCRNPSEISALHWGNIDFNNSTIHIAQRIIDGKLIPGTKTNQNRTVYLTAEAMASLKAMKQYTYLEGNFVFKSEQGNPFFSPNRNLNLVWNAAFKGTGIRTRPMRQTRHTAATTWIMANMNIKFVADQLGDKVETVMRHYAKWIDSQGTASEMEKLKDYHFKFENNSS